MIWYVLVNLVAFGMYVLSVNATVPERSLQSCWNGPRELGGWRERVEGEWARAGRIPRGHELVGSRGAESSYKAEGALLAM